MQQSRPAEPSSQSGPEIIRVSGLSNAEFLDGYGQAGRVGLSGGQTLLDRAIQRAQRHIDERKVWGLWTHVFLLQGRRVDGHQWVVESDLQIIRKHISLGAQENRITKYHDPVYTSLAVLDFGLSAAESNQLVARALDLIAARTRYSVRELVGTLFALRHPDFRGQDNLLSRDNSMYCSAFVEHLFRGIGRDLVRDIHEKNVAPEDIFRSPCLKRAWVLDRTERPTTLAGVSTKLKRRIGARVRLLRRKTAANQPANQ